MMEQPKQPNEEPELVTIEGLQFKPYQVQFMEVFVKLRGYPNVTKWIHDCVLLDLIAKSEVIYENYAEPFVEKLEQDGYRRW